MSRRSLVVFFTFALFFYSNNGVAGIGSWKNYTSMKNVRAVASDDRSVWVATTGGVFRFNPSDSTYQKFVNSDGLSTNTVTAVYADSTGKIWIGHQSGHIDVYDSKNASWKYITDVALSGKTNSAINSFYRSGDKMYIATSFGIAVFSVTKFEFSDTYTVFGSVIQPNVLSISLFQNRVFAATNAGIVASKVGAVNLAAPESWEVFLPAISTGNRLAEFNNGLFVSTASGMQTFQNNVWATVAGIFSSVKIFSSLDTSLLFVDGTNVRSLNTANNVSTIATSIPAEVTGGTMLNGKIFLGFESNGLGTPKTPSSWSKYYPNGPNSNGFYQLVMDEKGVLWTASGRSNGNGFFSFDGTTWRNYSTENTPALLSNDCFAISVGPNNSKWISTWGEGLMLVNDHGDVVRRFDYSNPGFFGVVRNDGSGLPSYVVPSKIATDRTGNVWVSCYLSVDNNKVLWKMNPDSTWEFSSGSPYGSYQSFMHGIIIDQNQTKWFINAVNGRPSTSATIVYYNDLKILPGSTPTGWGTITLEDGATNTETQTMVIDKDGDLWIGTGAGITIITDVNNPKTRVSKVFLGAVRDQYINCIAVDPLNNKWVATSTGVFVLSPDGTQLLQQYNVLLSGGKMLDDNVISIVFDTKKGIAYFGTEKGLSSVEIAAVAVKNSFSSIDLSPNPIYLPSQSMVEIRGLVDESTIKVLALNGKVIKQFPAQGGGRAFWDCRDDKGRLVASGVYIIVAHNRAGDQVASSKIAVIQK